MYVVTFIDGSYFIITEDQADVISATKNAGKVQSLKLQGQFIVMNQVSGIPTLDAFRRNMKHKLAQKNLRMCRKCHEIVPRMDNCPCKENPEKYPEIMAEAVKENPKLAGFLSQQTERMSLPSGRL